MTSDRDQEFVDFVHAASPRLLDPHIDHQRRAVREVSRSDATNYRRRDQYRVTPST